MCLHGTFYTGHQQNFTLLLEGRLIFISPLLRFFQYAKLQITYQKMQQK